MSQEPTVEQIIHAIDLSLECDNRHDESATKIWAKLNRFVKPGKEVQAARELGDAMCPGWEYFLRAS